MSTRQAKIPFFIWMVLFTLTVLRGVSFGAPTHPSLLFSSEDIPFLQDKANSTHQEIWGRIKGYTDSQLGTQPPPEDQIPIGDSGLSPWDGYGNRVVVLPLPM
jgi:hypothetical protein